MDSKFGYPDLSPSAPSPQYQQLPPPPPYSSAENYSVQASPYPGGPSQSQPPSYPPPPPGMASSPMLGKFVIFLPRARRLNLRPNLKICHIVVLLSFVSNENEIYSFF